jgi:hypothetical protein
MTVVEWTAVATIAIAGTGTVVIPFWLQRRKQRAEVDSTTVVSWTSITAAIQKERDGLREQLDKIDERYRLRMQEIEADWEKRMAVAKQRTVDLENEVDRLRHELRGTTPETGSR